MYKAGHLLRRSSVRLKSLSGGHNHLQMIISQLREVRSTFKAFVVAQSTLSEDLMKWSSAIENEPIQGSFLHLAELNSLWTEVQKDLIDSLKLFRYSFECILEGEKHVDQAKQVFAAREEMERCIRKELQKAYNKAPCEEVQLVNLRGKLSRSEKAKELAHIDVVDRVRENEAVRMIRLKESIGKLGDSYWEMGQKASIIFRAQRKIAQEMPDVHEKAIHNIKYRGNANTQHVEDAKEKLRSFCASPKTRTFEEPPPPYTPSREKLNDLSFGFSDGGSPESVCIPGGRDSFGPPSAPNRSNDSLNRVSVSPEKIVYPTLPRPEEEEIPAATGITRNNSAFKRWSAADSFEEPKNDVLNASTNSEFKPKRSFRFRSLSRRRAREKENNSSPVNESYPSTSPLSSSTTPPLSSPMSSFSSSESPPHTSHLPTHPHFSPPPPYNPFYEWSEFPDKEQTEE